MPTRTIVHKVPQSAAQMFSLVADVKKYPEFLPGCRSLRVISRDQAGEAETIIADMVVGYKIITETFRSRIKLRDADGAIDVHYIKGPFSHLDNNWRFRDLEQGGSEIEFHIDFELRHKGIGVLVGGLFEQVFMRLLDAFEARAKIIFPV